MASGWWVAWLLLALVGCGAAPGVAVDHLELRGESLTVPGRIDPAALERGQPFSLRARVELPASMRGQPVDLSIPLFEAHARLLADGEPAVVVSAAEGYRQAGPQRFSIPSGATDDGVIELELRVEHRWAKSGWLLTVPQLLPAGAADPRADAVRWFNVYGGWMALAALLQVGLTCLLVFFLDRRRRPYLWFGIQAICAMSYPAFISGASVRLGAVLELPFVELGLVGALWSSLHFTHTFYSLGPVPRWLDGAMAVATVVSVAFIDPFSAGVAAARLVAAAVGGCVVYQLVTLVRLLRARREDRASVALLMCAWLALAFGTWADVLSWILSSEPLGGVRPACVGLVVFALFLSLVLSRSHIRSLRHADELNVALAHRVEEVEAERARAEGLNEELRFQVADRSAQLFAALGLIEAEAGGAARVLEPGMEINGRYRIVGVIGSGAMGMVYEATRISDGSRWALKVANELRGAALARLAREAHVASKLRHDNVVQIRDIDVSTLGFMYIVLELIEGPSLRERLREGGPPPAAEARRLLLQIARGLAALHEASIVHRDLKPANVLLGERDGEVVAKIADFGISRLGEGETSLPVSPPEISTVLASGQATLSLARETRGGPTEADPGQETTDVGFPVPPQQELAESLDPRDAETRGLDEQGGAHRIDLAELARGTGTGVSTPSSLELTGRGFLIGTPHYIAPELAGGGPLNDPRADLFSLGVLAFELLTGARPFEHAVAPRLLRGEAVDDTPIPRLPPGLADLQSLLERCLDFDPAARPTAAQVVEQLGSLLQRARA